MKVVFLDIDGVLNSRAWFLRADSDVLHLSIDPEACGLVQHLCDETGAVIVISSTWRIVHRLNKIRALLNACGLVAPVIDVTPHLGRERGHEFQAWLNAPRIFPLTLEGMVILDDDADMAHLSPWLVKTKFSKGLTQIEAARAKRTLQEPMPMGLAEARG